MNLNHELKIYLRFLKYLGIKISLNDFKKQLETHPDYPSILSVSDTLTLYSISHRVIKAQLQDFEELSDIFLIISTNTSKKVFPVLIKKEGGIFYSISPFFAKGKKKINDISEIWTGTVLILDGSIPAVDNYKQESNTLLFPGIIFIIVFITISFFSRKLYPDILISFFVDGVIFFG